MSRPDLPSRGGRQSRPLVVVLVAALGVGALGGATGALLGGASRLSAKIEQAEHGAARNGDDAFERHGEDARGENEPGAPAPAPAPVAPAPVQPRPPGR